MEKIDILLARTTYVLQVIEKSLGEFAIERAISSGVDSEDDADAESRGGGSFQDRVSESYLSDLFGLALQASAGTNAHAEVLHLKALAEALGIYEIRNACAHPNRPFLPHYWYRIASLAQDPSFKIIGLEHVSEALAKAESDSLVLADNGWTIALKAVIPNNIPTSFEHDRTGLLGRDQIVEQVAKLMTVGRFPTVAIVAPGGVGKTALALEVLKKVAYASTANKLEQVIFVSLKTQKLTSDGLKILDELPTLEDLEGKIAHELREAFEEAPESNLDEMIEAYALKPILICIDNLENLLLGNASQFEQLLEKLPSAWRLMITTRIPVNSAHCISLAVLQPTMAGNLAMGYSRSVGLKLSRADSDAIARTCNFNPLAIKLSVDAISAGKGVEDALTVATSDTLRFSYDLLLDVLGRDEVVVLEVLFATGSITRSDIALVLDIDAPAIAAALSILSRTSLIHSSLEGGVEKYALNDAVRELLRTHPRNLELRSEVSNKVATRRQQADGLQLEAERRGFSEFSEFHVPPSQPIALREISHLVKRAKDDDIRVALTKLSIIESDCRAVDTYWLLRGIALASVRDPEAEFALARAVELSGAARAQASLAHWLLINKRYPESADRYLVLKDSGGCDGSHVGPTIALRNVHGLLLASLFAMRYEEVMRLTREFVTAGFATDRICAARISAARMLYDHSRDLGMLRESFEVFDVAAGRFGCTSPLAKEGMKLIIDLLFYCSNGGLDAAIASDAARFIVTHYDAIISAAPVKVLTDNSWSASKLLAVGDMLDPSDPLREGIYRIVGVKFSADRLGGLGSIPVKVCDFSYSASLNYRFAVDRDGARHYLRFEQFEGGQDDWQRLLPRKQIYIVPGEIEAGSAMCPRAMRIAMTPILAGEVV